MQSPVVFAAVSFLVESQAADGSFRDYELPVGASDQWVTAYTGLALARAARASIPHADEASRRAANWLARNRTYEEGWGFNATTGADADSTAHAILLLSAAGLCPPVAASKWLSSLWRPQQGFATYAQGKAWSTGHPCVTPVVYSALHALGIRENLKDVLEVIRQTRLPDGSWASYWWRTNRYAEWVTLELLAELGRLDLAELPTRETRSYSFESAFELACICGSQRIRYPKESMSCPFIEALTHYQSVDGSWPGGFELRVTDDDCYQPWVAPSGLLYLDQRGVLTTATCLRAMVDAV